MQNYSFCGVVILFYKIVLMSYYIWHIVKYKYESIYLYLFDQFAIISGFWCFLIWVTLYICILVHAQVVRGIFLRYASAITILCWINNATIRSQTCALCSLNKKWNKGPANTKKKNWFYSQEQISLLRRV